MDPDADRIDFISAYCDRWCERCAFTSRCSAYAVQIAEAMCSDFKEALELAVGIPHPESNEEAPRPSAQWIAEMNADDRSDAEIEAALRENEARRAQAEASPVAQLAAACLTVAWRWLQSRSGETPPSADPLLKEAFDVALWDAHFITVKLARAFIGRLQFRAGESFEDDPIQNDWNGSAKIALISIERSGQAWRTIAQAVGGETPAAVADQLGELRQQVEAEFPDAWNFIRPGFDDPRQP